MKPHSNLTTKKSPWPKRAHELDDAKVDELLLMASQELE